MTDREQTLGVGVSRCMQCGHESFPQRLWCPLCHSGELVIHHVDRGTLREITSINRTIAGQLEHPVAVGTVHADGGAVLIARIADELTPGDRVALLDDDGTPVATSAPSRSR